MLEDETWKKESGGSEEGRRVANNAMHDETFDIAQRISELFRANNGIFESGHFAIVPCIRGKLACVGYCDLG